MAPKRSTSVGKAPGSSKKAVPSRKRKAESSVERTVTTRQTFEGRRAYSRATSSARQSNINEQVGTEKRKGRKAKEKEEKKQIEGIKRRGRKKKVEASCEKEVSELEAMRLNGEDGVETEVRLETSNHLGTSHLYINRQAAGEIEQHFSSPRLDWLDLIVDVRMKMPWIREGKALRPSSHLSAREMGREHIDLFNSFYDELNDESNSRLLTEINSSNAMEMFECEWEEASPRRPSLALMIKMLHECAVKRHAEDLSVPERACAALKKVLSTILPSSAFGRYYWLSVLSGGCEGIKGRGPQLVEEMAKRCKTFFIKSLLTESFLPCIAQFVTYFFEVDFLCAQTEVIEYDLPGRRKEEEEESLEDQRSKNDKRKKNPLENFPLVLLLVLDLDESPRRGLSESAILMIQKLLEQVVKTSRSQEWVLSATIKRALLCLLEAVRWHCAKATRSSVIGGVQTTDREHKVSVELQQNIQTAVRWIINKGWPMAEVREVLCLGWLEDIINDMD